MILIQIQRLAENSKLFNTSLNEYKQNQLYSRMEERGNIFQDKTLMNRNSGELKYKKSPRQFDLLRAFLFVFTMFID